MFGERQLTNIELVEDLEHHKGVEEDRVML
jgi:hypothetical protein